MYQQKLKKFKISVFLSINIQIKRHFYKIKLQLLKINIFRIIYLKQEFKKFERFQDENLNRITNNGWHIIHVAKRY